ncbi:KUP/HAK/KT family potassium transporter [Salmonella enterica]|uniref:KUP/HAK/KT family potassium transporter n=1 Tax=Salmonella enterica TaxID=28901 RepID=UPI00397CE2C5
MDNNFLFTGGSQSSKNMLDIVSQIFCSLVLITSLMYALYVICIDNHGERGIVYNPGSVTGFYLFLQNDYLNDNLFYLYSGAALILLIL